MGTYSPVSSACSAVPPVPVVSLQVHRGEPLHCQIWHQLAGPSKVSTVPSAQEKKIKKCTAALALGAIGFLTIHGQRSNQYALSFIGDSPSSSTLAQHMCLSFITLLHELRSGTKNRYNVRRQLFTVPPRSAHVPDTNLQPCISSQVEVKQNDKRQTKKKKPWLASSLLKFDSLQCSRYLSGCKRNSLNATLLKMLMAISRTPKLSDVSFIFDHFSKMYIENAANCC